ncbi:lysozyme inhibitor LprI family protein [Pontibacter sp. JAM-7]|uniref:lysozyme inhibitor LprI family protein n=1 Tax=Pontibacter sp. JAM-7 TaxID=3366581 RepID=UPI003AF7F3DA
MKKILIFSLLLASSLSVGADPRENEELHPIDVNLTHCLSLEKNMTTSGMERCTIEAIKEWDSELNRTYKALMSQLDTPSKEQLKLAQRAWVKYKELEIKNISSIYRYSFHSGNGGSMLIPMQAMDELEITKSRTLELTGYLSII